MRWRQRDRGAASGAVMAAAKSSVRSRNVASQPGVPQANGHSNYDAYPGEQLTAFETENFDAKGYVETKCQSMSEKVCFFRSSSWFYR